MHQLPQAQTSSNLTMVDRYLPDTNVLSEPYGQVPILNLNTIRAMLWRQRWLILSIVGIVAALGLIATLLMTPIYQATATVRVNNQTSEIIEGGELDPYISSSEVSTYLNTLAEVIQSNKMALAVVDDLGLVEGAGNAEGAAPSPATETQRQNLAAGLAGTVAVDIPMDSRIIAITYSSPDPREAARIANAYAENFLQEDLRQGLEANSYAREYLEEQIAETRDNLTNAEKAAVEYARSNRIIGEAMFDTGSYFTDNNAAASGTAPTITVTNLASINSAMMAARERRIAAEQRWNTASGIPALQLPEVRENGMVQSLRTELAQAQSRRSNLAQRYQSDYPEIVELTAQISNLNTEISAASEQIKRSIRDQYQIALRQEQALQREANSVSSQTLDEQDRRLEYNLLQRDAVAFRTQLDTLLHRYNQLAAASNIRSSDVTLLDTAGVPSSPSSPNLFKNMAAALLLGFALAAVIAVLREALDDRLRSSEDIERKLNARTLGQTPYVTDEMGGEMEDFFSPISEAYSSVRASLDYQLPSVECPVIQFTSSQPSEGKTTSAIATARKYASIGRKVLLIDMDLRRPSVAGQLLDERPKLGIVDAIYMHVPLEQAIVHDVANNLDVLPVGAVPDNPAEILSSGLVAELFSKCRLEYDVIIVDSSPVMGIADAPLLSRFVDAVVFIVEANKAQAGQARAALARLRDMNANLLGVVLTKYRALQAGESYEYQYKYYTYDSKAA